MNVETNSHKASKVVGKTKDKETKRTDKKNLPTFLRNQKKTPRFQVETKCFKVSQCECLHSLQWLRGRQKWQSKQQRQRLSNMRIYREP